MRYSEVGFKEYEMYVKKNDKTNFKVLPNVGKALDHSNYNWFREKFSKFENRSDGNGQ